MSGRLEEPTGRIEVSWRVSGEGAEATLLIDWLEIAPDPAADEDKPTSWADWLEQAIVHQLGGTMSKAPKGGERLTRFRLPLANVC